MQNPKQTMYHKRSVVNLRSEHLH